jgi:uncharacterized protein with HEPN domain
MRNWLAHGYDGIDYDILWDAVSRHAGDLLAKIDPLISDAMRAGSGEPGGERVDGS